MISGPDFRVINSNKKVKNVVGIDKIALNIRNALETPLGLRPNLPTFGSRIGEYKFDLIGENLIDLVAVAIQECIAVSVPEVNLVSLSYSILGERELLYSIKFKVKSTGLVGEADYTFRGGEYNGE